VARPPGVKSGRFVSIWYATCHDHKTAQSNATWNYITMKHREKMLQTVINRQVIEIYITSQTQCLKGSANRNLQAWPNYIKDYKEKLFLE